VSVSEHLNFRQMDEWANQSAPRGKGRGVGDAPTPEEYVRSALLRVADNVAKHVVQRTGLHDPDDRCFVADLRESEAELLSALRDAEARGAGGDARAGGGARAGAA
jgi:hypothetical protein